MPPAFAGYCAIFRPLPQLALWTIVTSACFAGYNRIMKILVTGASKIYGMNLTTSSQILICLITIVFLLQGCSTIQLSNPETESRFENKDFSNKPVNLNNSEERQKFEEISREVEKNRSVWKEKNISDYDFVCERHGEGSGGDFIVATKVRRNQTLHVNKDNNMFSVKDINDFPYYKEINSIEKMFDYIQGMLEEGYRIKVTFDNQYGFPEQIEIKMDGSGWVNIKIKQFQIVK
jgi:hypothetical protein